MTHVSQAEADALLRAAAFEEGLRRVPHDLVRSDAVSELERRGLVDTAVVVLWRRTPEGERVAREVAEKRRRAA